jgi:hypothetical protein
MTDVSILTEGRDDERGPRGHRGHRGATGPAGVSDVFPFAASWRVQWNGGTPIVTVKDIVAPPGISVGLAPISNRGEATLYVFGDSITRGAVTAVIGTPLAPATNELLATMLQGYNVGGSWVVPVDAAGVTGPTPAQVAAAIPALPPVVPGQLILVATVRARYQSGATTNNTAALLEDVTLSFSGAVGP